MTLNLTSWAVIGVCYIGVAFAWRRYSTERRRAAKAEALQAWADNHTPHPSERVPEPPRNVRVEIGDRIVALDCRFSHWDTNGIAHWKVVNMPQGKVTGIRADMIPPDTAIGIDLTFHHDDWYEK